MKDRMYVAKTNVGEIYSECYPEPHTIAKIAFHHSRYYKNPPRMIKIYGSPERVVLDLKDVPVSRIVK